MSIRDNNQQLDMRVLTRSGALGCGIQTSSEYTDPCQCARKPALGLSDLEHGNETAVQTDSVRETRHRLSVRFLLMTSPPLQLSN